MKRIIQALCITAAACALTASLAMAQQGPSQITFCRSADFANWQPIDPGNIFDTNIISIMFETPTAFGADFLTLTEYKQVGGGESITFRTDVAVSPEWGGFLVTDYTFPEPGAFRITFSLPNGTVIAEGLVEILVDQQDIIETEHPEELQTEGKTLGDFFNQYRPAQ